MILQANAKINLFLHVVGKDRSGYHELESLVAFADICDELDIHPSSENSLIVGGLFEKYCGNARENIVLKTIEKFSDNENFSVRLTKNIPTMAGLGGGSADAGAVLRYLNNANISHDKLLDIGADVPVCFANKPSWISGDVQKTTPLKKFPSVPIVLVYPMVGCSTAEVFNGFYGNFDMPINKLPCEFSSLSALFEFLKSTTNALETPAINSQPIIRETLQTIKKSGAVISRMSGSGSCCFGLFNEVIDAQNATYRIKNDNPKWWVKCANLLCSA